MKIRLIIAAACAAIALAIPSFSQDVVTTPAPVSTNAPIPHYVRYSGTLPDGGSKSLQIRFSLYENQTGGQPVWSEVQTVTPVEGKYAVLLGAGTENGLPQSVFSAAQARWLGISIGAGQEQPRTILLATPYSLEASDAQTLAGHPASDFVLAGSNPAPKSETSKAKPNTATDISQINVNSGLTITNGGTGPTVTMGIDATKVPFLASANTFTATQTISSGNIAIPATTSKTSGVITSGGNAIFQSFSKTSGANNLFLGAGSGNFTNSGKNNTGVGNVSLSQLTTAAGNMALGTDSLGKTTSGPYNTAIGAFAGYYNITGSYNTFIGNSAGPPSGSSALTNATAIGASSVVNESNAVVLGGTGAYAVNVGIGTATPAYTLDVQGTGNFTGAVNFGASQSVTGDIIATTFLEAYPGQSNGADYAAVLGWGSNGSVGTFGYSDSGYGVQGDSASGNGVYGTTGGLNAFAIYGYTTANGAVGVYGEAGGAVNGSASPIGVKGIASGNDGNGLVGDETGTGGYGLYAHASGGQDSVRYAPAGVYALSESGTGALGINTGLSSTFTTYQQGFSPSVTGGVWGDTSSDGADFQAGGIVGTADNNSAAFFANNSDNEATVYATNAGTGSTGLFSTLKASTRTGTCGFGGAGNMICTGQVETLTTSPDGAHTVETYAMQSPENWMEDFGTGNLNNGVAVITIEPGFAATVSETADYHVFLTPNGDAKGLYVINKTATSFEVHESGGGSSSLSFDYRIVAKRRGYESQRLADVSKPFAAEQAKTKRLTPTHFLPAAKAVVEPSRPPAVHHTVRPQLPKEAPNKTASLAHTPGQIQP